MVAGKYIVESIWGRAGVATVLSALEVGRGRRVALNILLPEWANDAGVIERFFEEARAATQICSEHVVRVLDVGMLREGTPFLVLESVQGQNLEELIAREGRLTLATAVDWLLQAGEAIAEAHTRGIVHRRLRTASLFLTHGLDGQPCIKVNDFGLWTLTDLRPRPSTATPMRSPGSIDLSRVPPEQLRASDDLDERADIWALAAIFHELVTGQPAFHGASNVEVRAAILAGAPTPMSWVVAVPDVVERAVLRGLARDPNTRFASVEEFASALAPSGTAAARSSLARIECMLPGMVGQDRTDHPRSSRGSDFGDVDTRMGRPLLGTPPSARVVVGSLLVMGALGAGAFMEIYDAVHANDPPATSLQSVERQTQGTVTSHHAIVGAAPATLAPRALPFAPTPHSNRPSNDDEAAASASAPLPSAHTAQNNAKGMPLRLASKKAPIQTKERATAHAGATPAGGSTTRARPVRAKLARTGPAAAASSDSEAANESAEGASDEGSLPHDALDSNHGSSESTANTISQTPAEPGQTPAEPGAIATSPMHSQPAAAPPSNDRAPLPPAPAGDELFDGRK
jgi:serine/threonine-protein kinase